MHRGPLCCAQEPPGSGRAGAGGGGGAVVLVAHDSAGVCGGVHVPQLVLVLVCVESQFGSSRSDSICKITLDTISSTRDSRGRGSTILEMDGAKEISEYSAPPPVQRRRSSSLAPSLARLRASSLVPTLRRPPPPAQSSSDEQIKSEVPSGLENSDETRQLQFLVHKGASYFG